MLLASVVGLQLMLVIINNYNVHCSLSKEILKYSY